MREGEWYIDGHKVKISARRHSLCCACNCVVDLIRELRARIAKLEKCEDNCPGVMLPEHDCPCGAWGRRNEVC